MVNLAGSKRAVVANNIIDDPLVRRERVEALLFDLCPSIFSSVYENIVGDLLVIFAISRAGCAAKHPDRETGVASGGISDLIELVVGDNVLFKAPLRSRTQNVVELFVVVLVHPDVFAGAQPTYEPVVDAAEQLFFLVRDTDHRELLHTVEVVDEARVFELVDLVEDDDGSRTVVLLEPVNELVVRCRLAMDVYRRADVVEDLVQRSEAAVVAPAVDVGGLDVEHFLAEPFGNELRDTGFADTARAGDNGCVSRLAVRDRFENAREVVDFGVAMLDFSRDEPGAEDASITDHLFLPE